MHTTAFKTWNVVCVHPIGVYIIFLLCGQKCLFTCQNKKYIYMYHIYMDVCNKIDSSWCWPVHWQPNLIYEDNDATKVLQFNLWDQILHHWSQRVRLMAKTIITWYVECGTPPRFSQWQVPGLAWYSLIHTFSPVKNAPDVEPQDPNTQLFGWCLYIPNPTKVAWQNENSLLKNMGRCLMESC